MRKIKPKKLEIGDTIGIIAVSGRIKEYEKIENAKKFFDNCGYNVVISESCKDSHRYMAGTCDEDCIKTIHSFFENPKINAIICARGGYGTLRLMNKLDYELIKNNPKIFGGYSDITILLNMIYKKTGLITFHSAMPNGDFSSEINEYTKESFFKTLKGENKTFNSENGICFKEGKAKGILWGGNLAVLSSMCGTDFVPDSDLLLFLEDLNEPEYKIDRMITQLFNVEKIRNNVKGLILGEFKDVQNKELLNEILSEFATDLNIPVADGFKITHGKTKDTIPIGVFAEFDSSEGIVRINENYVV